MVELPQLRLNRGIRSPALDLSNMPQPAIDLLFDSALVVELVRQGRMNLC